MCVRVLYLLLRIPPPPPPFLSVTRLPRKEDSRLFYRCRIHSTDISNTIHMYDYCECLCVRVFFQVLSYIISFHKFSNVNRIEICAESSEWNFRRRRRHHHPKQIMAFDCVCVCVRAYVSLIRFILFSRILFALYCLCLFIFTYSNICINWDVVDDVEGASRIKANTIHI